MEIYINRVDTLIKLLHLPTFWSTLMAALQKFMACRRAWDSYICILFVIIISLDDNECYDILGEQKAIVPAQYGIASRQAMINANFSIRPV